MIEESSAHVPQSPPCVVLEKIIPIIPAEAYNNFFVPSVQ